MKHCDICNVNVNTNKNYCPLCFNQIKNNGASQPVYLTNTKKETDNKKKYLATKILLFLTISALVICGFINFLTYSGVLWSLLIGSSLLYLWILIKHTIISNRNAFEKVFFQLVGIILIVVCSYIVSGGGNWLYNYVLPSIAILTIIVLSFVMACSKHRKKFLVSFLVIFILLLIMSIILIACKVDEFKILNEINLVVSGLAIFGSLIFGFKTIKSELSKKLHI